MPADGTERAPSGMRLFTAHNSRGEPVGEGVVFSTGTVVVNEVRRNLALYEDFEDFATVVRRTHRFRDVQFADGEVVEL